MKNGIRKQISIDKLLSFDDFKKEYFAKNPEDVALLKQSVVDEYNNSDDISLEALTAVLQKVVKLEGVTKVARETNLSRENLHRTFSLKGNPRAKTITAVARFAGYKIALVPLHK
ncbi:MAG: hypothetical protein LBT18_02800 [Endomicrobium sp.]|jgi:probable addiction module antidote protein|nr:hypothetical protein [Endomicrobium sp.]